ncbi:MAG: GldG family protein [Candidatus Tectomicrobia bacterium]|uniref:GldG family protein n=1 Tax=Tectimicrobiota bacterium TaxID=2528274 RepID=A0A932FVM5_UNCTE|nr:GldG family protein [Candidatus Tectomicrobia bacterium]
MMKGTIETLKGTFSRRSTRYGINATLLTLLVLGILILVEVLAARNSWRWDLTSNRRYTLSDQSRKVVQELRKPIQITAFYREGEPGRGRLQELIDQYSHYSKQIRFEFVDPDRNPAKTKRYEITSYGTTVVESDGKMERVTDPQEEEITNAILKVTKAGKKVVYFLEGHGEPDLEETAGPGYNKAKQAIEKQLYEVRKLLLLREDQVPADAAVVIVSGPRKDLLPEELARLQAYLLQGGSCLFLLDPYAAPGLVAWLEKYGIRVGQDIIVDRMSRIFGADFTMPVVSFYAPHRITRDFKLVSFFPLARSVNPTTPLPAGVEAQALAKTSADSWADADPNLLQKGEAQYDDGKDRPGPVSVAVVATLRLKELAPELKAGGVKPVSAAKGKEHARLVIFGDSEFAGNAYLTVSGNEDLLLNTVSWLAEEEALISIRPKATRGNPVILTSHQAQVIFWVPVVLLPLSVLLIGISVLNRRRQVR